MLSASHIRRSGQFAGCGHWVVSKVKAAHPDLGARQDNFKTTLLSRDGMRREHGTRGTPEVCFTCMARSRTNIEIDDGYVRTVMDRYGIHTKTEAVDLALRHLAGQPMTRDEALAMRGAHALDDLPADTGPRPGA